MNYKISSLFSIMPVEAYYDKGDILDLTNEIKWYSFPILSFRLSLASNNDNYAAIKTGLGFYNNYNNGIETDYVHRSVAGIYITNGFRISNATSRKLEKTKYNVVFNNLRKSHGSYDTGFRINTQIDLRSKYGNAVINRRSGYNISINRLGKGGFRINTMLSITACNIIYDTSYGVHRKAGVGKFKFCNL